MIFYILFTCLILGIGFINFIMYMYSYVMVLIHISERRFNYLNYGDYYIINEILTNNNIVYLNNNELKSYYCHIAYNTMEDSKLHLYCYDYNINRININGKNINGNKINGKKKMFFNVNNEDVDLLSNYKSLMNLYILSNKIPNDIIIEISKFISNIEINKNTKINI